MSSISKKDNGKQFYLPALLCLSLAAIAIVLLTTQNYGLGVTPDSVEYLKAADQIEAGENLTNPLWPPFYPFSLYLSSWLLRIPVLEAARITNAILFGIFILVAGTYFHENLEATDFIQLLCTASLVISVPLVPIFLNAWSEPLFIVLTSLFLLFFDRFLKKQKLTDLLFSALFVSLACLTRYIGQAFAFFGAVTLIVINWKKFREKIREPIIFLLISLLPIVILLIRNKLLLDTFTGQRFPSEYSYAENIRSLGSNLLNWYLPGLGRTFKWGAVLFIVILLVIFRRKIWDILTKKGQWQIPFFFMLSYLFFLVASSSSSFLQLIDNRYLSPIALPVYFLFFFFVIELFNSYREEVGKSFFEIALPGLILLSLALPISHTFQTIVYRHRYGYGFTDKSWKESQTMKFLIEQKPPCPIYSNGNDVIELYTGNEAFSSPYASMGSTTLATLESLKYSWPPQQSVCLVWFNNISWREYLFSPADLLKIAHLDKELTFADGTIYYLSREK